MMRTYEGITPLLKSEAITPEISKQLIYSILSEAQREKFEKNWELDASVFIANIGRFRLNAFMQKNGMEAVLRVIPSVIPEPEDIDISPGIIDLTNHNKGLVLVTGPTGSGKSTTLACLINIINQKRKCNIITIEDPIEFVYEPKLAIIRQREVGQHTLSFANALKYSLRQDPDVVLIGEMRDLETISAALTMSETGHLVLATLHTSDAAQTVDRIIDVFPPYQQQQIRVMLAGSLKAVVSQILLPRSDMDGRVAAREVMIVTPALANLIREGKTHQIYSAIDLGAKLGMISMDKALVELVRQGKVSIEDAVAKAQNPNMVRSSVQGAV